MAVQLNQVVTVAVSGAIIGFILSWAESEFGNKMHFDLMYSLSNALTHGGVAAGALFVADML